MFYDKERNNSNIQALTQALANSNRGDVNITPFVPTSPQPQQQTQSESSLGDITKLATPLLKAGINKFGNTDNTGNTIISDAINSEVTGTNFNNGGIMDTIRDNTAESLSSTGNLFGGVTNSGFGGSGLGYLGLAQGLTNGLNQGFNTSDDKKIWGGAGNGIQGFFGVDNENQSDVEQGISGTINGASKGAMFGPIGAVVGGLLGLGSSFIDDIGGE